MVQVEQSDEISLLFLAWSTAGLPQASLRPSALQVCTAHYLLMFLSVDVHEPENRSR